MQNLKLREVRDEQLSSTWLCQRMFTLRLEDTSKEVTDLQPRKLNVVSLANLDSPSVHRVMHVVDIETYLNVIFCILLSPSV